MREGYGSHSVCLSVTKLAATYLVCESKVQHYKVPYGIPNACIVWILLKTLFSSVLGSFANAKLLDFSPSDSSITLHIGTLCTCVLYGIISVRGCGSAGSHSL